ncbi:hypothetical protein D3C85_966820 [compost metagenome]
MHEAFDDRVVAQPAAGFRLPAAQSRKAGRLQYPGLARQLTVAAQDQVGQGAPTQIAGADAFAAKSARKGNACGRVAEHVRMKAPGHAQVAAPGVGDAHVLELWEQFAEQVATQVDFVVGEVEIFTQATGKAVSTTGTEDQAVVGAALAVGHLATVFAEGLALVQADLRPDVFRQWLGGHDQALHRHLVTTERRQGDGVTFHGGDNPACLDLRVCGLQPAGLPVGHRAVLVQLYAQALDCFGQPAHQPGRLDGRAMG